MNVKETDRQWLRQIAGALRGDKPLSKKDRKQIALTLDVIEEHIKEGYDS